MPTTPILAIEQVSASQNQKEVTINDAIEALENATNRKLAVSFASSATVTLSDSQITRNFLFEATGATAAATLRVPNTVNGSNLNRIFAVRNASGQSLTVKFVSGVGTTVVIPDGETRLLAATGGLNVRVAAEPPTVATFLSLTDTPLSYATFAGKFLAVNATEDALEFMDAAVFPDFVGNLGKVLAVNAAEDGVEWIDVTTDFTSLTDVPTSYTGQAGKIVSVKNTEDGLEFIDAPDSEAVEYVASDQWRIRVVLGGTDTQVGFAEVQFLDQDYLNIATGGTADASSYDVSFEPENAFDADLSSGTGWLSEADDVIDATIGYTFSAPVYARYVKLWPFEPLTAEYTPTRFVIERWNGSAWVAAGERIPATWVGGEPQTFKINGVPLSSVSDAPVDGNIYGRKDAGWVAIDEQVRDVVGTALDAGTAISISVDDGGDTITIGVTPDTDGTLAANSDTAVPSQKAVKTYVDQAVTGLLDFKGVTDCSANPNYPAASKGDAYVVSVAGKIGGASGTVVDAGDWYIAIADNAGGTEAAVGASWRSIERNSALQVLSTGAVFSGAVSVPDDAYDATTWNGSLEVPTKNAVRDKIEALISAGGYTDEQVRDVIGTALQQGTGITITVNDAGDQITIAADTAVIDERARDAVGTALVPGSGITITPNDGADTITISATGGGGAAFQGALVKKTTAQSLLTLTTTTITFDAEEYDTSGFHDNVTNNSRLTVPAGVTKVRLSARLSRTSQTGQVVLSMLKNGSGAAVGLAQIDTDTAGTDHVTAQSAVLSVTAGDYFELQGYVEGASDITTESWFAIEVVETSSTAYAPTAATASQVWTGTTDLAALTPANMFSSAAGQVLTDGATITIDGNTGFNFRVTLGGSRTLANPTNMKAGQSGIIVVTQDATGSRTLSYGSNWRFPGGAAVGGVLSTAANAVDVITYYVRSDGTILANIGKDYKA